MDSVVLDFFRKYPLMAVSVIGSIIGTILDYIAPGFTYDYLCAKEDFGPGNLGLTVFVHANWGHLIGNLMVMFAPSIICQIKYGCKTTFILLAIFFPLYRLVNHSAKNLRRRLFRLRLYNACNGLRLRPSQMGLLSFDFLLYNGRCF